MSLALVLALGFGLLIGYSAVALVAIDIATDGRFVTWLFRGAV